MDKLNLAVFNTQPPHLSFGGVERRIIETTKRLVSRVNTRVYSGSRPDFKRTCSYQGVTFVPCYSTNILFPVDNWVFNQTISHMTHRIQADLYEAHTVSGYGFLKAIEDRDISTPFIQTIHGVLADEFIQSSKLPTRNARTNFTRLLTWHLSKIEKEAGQKATLVVTVSQYSLKKLVELYHIDQKKIRVAPNGVDVEKFKPLHNDETFLRHPCLKNKQYVLFVGRLVPRKGIPFLIEAAEQIIKERKDTGFLIVGDGPLKKHLIYLSQEKNLSDHFLFLGDIPDRLLPKLYNSADVFVLPSIQEGQGIALLEAQATGKPVVAFDVGGISEFVMDQETGLLVEPDSDKLADALLKLLSDEQMRKRMGRLGRTLVSENFSWDVCAEKMFKIYHEASEYANSK